MVDPNFSLRARQIKLVFLPIFAGRRHLTHSFHQTTLSTLGSFHGDGDVRQLENLPAPPAASLSEFTEAGWRLHLRKNFGRQVPTTQDEGVIIMITTRGLLLPIAIGFLQLSCTHTTDPVEIKDGMRSVVNDSSRFVLAISGNNFNSWDGYDLQMHASTIAISYGVNLAGGSGYIRLSNASDTTVWFAHFLETQAEVDTIAVQSPLRAFVVGVSCKGQLGFLITKVK